MSLVSFLPTFIKSQFFEHPEVPTADCSGKTIIVTGANVGLGKEAARHFVRLNATKVILACRTVSKGEAARADIEATTQRFGVVEVWPLDLEDYDSIRRLVNRAESLDRLDVVLENAGESKCDRQRRDVNCNSNRSHRSSSDAIQAGQRVRDRHFNQRNLDIPPRPSHPAEAARISTQVRHQADVDDCCV
jgi:NAD(P)-dependent dehydrogenase (short-subunit alcohol dehydrogenase family)